MASEETMLDMESDWDRDDEEAIDFEEEEGKQICICGERKADCGNCLLDK